jgi:DNA-binding XRE family transcriptional regulator
MGDVLPFTRARRPVPASGPGTVHGRQDPSVGFGATAGPSADRAPEPLWREVVGRQLREERTVRGERIADVAERAGVSPQYLSEVERGRKDASSEILSALAGALDLTVRELTRRAGTHLGTGGTGPVLLAA